MANSAAVPEIGPRLRLQQLRFCDKGCSDDQAILASELIAAQGNKG
jgi:hypothetical protein